MRTLRLPVGALLVAMVLSAVLAVGASATPVARTVATVQCEDIAGLPGLSIPCGLSEGLPVGLQLIGGQFAENVLFRIGHVLEQAIGFDTVPERLR